MAVKTALLKSLQTILHDCIREQEQIGHEDSLKDNQATLTLCSCIEAIFLHGKIHTHGLAKISKLFQGRNKRSSSDQQYHFWDVISEFVPPHMKESMSTCPSCTTSVGCCRMWVRASLNEGTLESYLSALINDQKKIMKHYSEWAFLRDMELRLAALELLKGLESLHFQLNLVNKELNDWSDSSALSLADISTPSSSKQVLVMGDSNSSSPSTSTLAQARTSSYHLLTTALPEDSSSSFTDTTGNAILHDDEEIHCEEQQKQTESISMAPAPSLSSTAAGPSIRVEEDEAAVLDDKEVMTFVSPEFDSLLQRSVRESRASSGASGTGSGTILSVSYSASPAGKSAAPSADAAASMREQENLHFLERSFIMQTENFLTLHGSARLPPEAVVPPAPHHDLPQAPPPDFTTASLAPRPVSPDTDAGPPTPSSATDLPAGSNSLSAQRSMNSWWSAPSQEQNPSDVSDGTPHAEPKTITVTDVRPSTPKQEVLPSPVVEEIKKKKKATENSKKQEVAPVSYDDAWSSALPGLLGTYEKMAQPTFRPLTVQVPQVSNLIRPQVMSSSVPSSSAWSRQADEEQTIMQSRRRLTQLGTPTQHTPPRPPATGGGSGKRSAGKDATTRPPPPTASQRHGDSTPNSEDGSESASDWQFLGSDFMDKLPVVRSRLLTVYPGVERFSHPTGVYGGKCTLCEAALNLSEDTIVFPVGRNLLTLASTPGNLEKYSLILAIQCKSENWMLDYYDGHLYCVNCHLDEKSLIPRDVINNWDFTEKPVSQVTRQFLQDLSGHPNMNVAQRNPLLYRAVPVLQRLCRLRRQLSLLWYQITLCDEQVAQRLSKHLGVRAYMLSSLQEVHLYSLEDLRLAHTGSLEKMLNNAIQSVALPHVTSCATCRQRTLTCELCYRRDRPIRLHDIDQYLQCSTPSCARIVHSECAKTQGNQSELTVLCRVCQNCLQNGLCPTASVGGFDLLASSSSASSSPAREAQRGTS